MKLAFPLFLTFLFAFAYNTNAQIPFPYRLTQLDVAKPDVGIYDQKFRISNFNLPIIPLYSEDSPVGAEFGIGNYGYRLKNRTTSDILIQNSLYGYGAVRLLLGYGDDYDDYFYGFVGYAARYNFQYREKMILANGGKEKFREWNSDRLIKWNHVASGGIIYNGWGFFGMYSFNDLFNREFIDENGNAPFENYGSSNVFTVGILVSINPLLRIFLD